LPYIKIGYQKNAKRRKELEYKVLISRRGIVEVKNNESYRRG
jgi:hypothetical protein